MGWIFKIISLSLFILACIGRLFIHVYQKNNVKTNAKIVDIKPTYIYDSEYRHKQNAFGYVYEYILDNGNKYCGEMKSFDDNKYQIGEEITLYYFKFLPKINSITNKPIDEDLEIYKEINKVAFVISIIIFAISFFIK